MTDQSQPNVTKGRLDSHYARPYASRTQVQRAVAAFIGARNGEPGWCISVKEVEDFIEQSPEYFPLLAAIEEISNVR